MLTVDAKVWIAAYDPQDRFHRDSVAFVSVVMRRQVRLFAPAIMPLEAACVLARRARRPDAGEAAFQRLQNAPGLRLLPLDERLLSVATRLGTQAFLRGTDTLYAAAASVSGSALISWDSELLERAGARSPGDWLAENA